MPQRPDHPEAPAERSGVLGALGDVPLVQLSFGTQAPRAGRSRWVVRTCTYSERISGCYAADLTLVTDDARVLAADMRGRHAFVRIERGHRRRTVQGLVTRVKEGHVAHGQRVVEITIEPAFALLSHVKRSRIFAERSVSEVLEAVLRDSLLPMGRSVKLELDATKLDKREYIVQHRESDHDFVVRLMAQEGLWFTFEHPDDPNAAEELVITNSNEKAKPIARSPEVKLALDRMPDAREEAIYELDGTLHTVPTAARVQMHNWTHPEVYERAEASVEDDSGLELGVSDYGDVHSPDFAKKTFSEHDTSRVVQLMLERLRATSHTIEGRSNVVLMRAGYRFESDGAQYLVTRVAHTISTATDDGRESHVASYDNAFGCMPIELPYRPDIETAKRSVGFHELATVVDASGGVTAPTSAGQGNDIAVDAQKHGRIRVKFHWDESEAGAGGTTSCWVRTMQPWAGKNWGFQFIPRVGMEVVVGFEGGDPDRPLVLGCVYNGLNPPPYAETPTQSGIKTASSVDPSRFNELRFEDAANQEQIFVRAQRDYVEEVLHDHSTTVTGKQTQLVKKTQTETVFGAQTLTVLGKRTKTIGGDKENGEEITVLGERSTTVTKKDTEVFQDEHQQTVEKAVTITHNDTRTTTVKKDDLETISDGNKTTTVAKGTYLLSSKQAMTLVQNSDHGLKFDNNAHLQTKADYTITNEKTQIGSEAAELKIRADSALQLKCGDAMIELKSDGSINITGKKISITAGNNSVVADQTGVTVSGVKISSTAVGIHEIQGAMIKIG
jgi:type VI secretion system secreted protein VgrG